MTPKQNQQPGHSWIRGATLSGLGAVIGTIAFAIFCLALGLNFSDEGWAEPDGRPWQVNRIYLAGSFVGFGVAILLFWIGVIQTTRSKD